MFRSLNKSVACYITAYNLYIYINGEISGIDQLRDKTQRHISVAMSQLQNMWTYMQVISELSHTTHKNGMRLADTIR